MSGERPAAALISGNNHLNVTASEETDYVYDGAGSVISSTYDHYGPGGAAELSIRNELHIDFAGRAHRNFFKVGSGTNTELRRDYYDARGRLAITAQGRAPGSPKA